MRWLHYIKTNSENKTKCPWMKISQLRKFKPKEIQILNTIMFESDTAFSTGI